MSEHSSSSVYYWQNMMQWRRHWNRDMLDGLDPVWTRSGPGLDPVWTWSLSIVYEWQFNVCDCVTLTDLRSAGWSHSDSNEADDVTDHHNMKGNMASWTNMNSAVWNKNNLFFNYSNKTVDFHLLFNKILYCILKGIFCVYNKHETTRHVFVLKLLLYKDSKTL